MKFSAFLVRKYEVETVFEKFDYLDVVTIEILLKLRHNIIKSYFTVISNHLKRQFVPTSNVYDQLQCSCFFY